MFNSFTASHLRTYQAWVTSGFRTPETSDIVRDFLSHLALETTTADHPILWKHQSEAFLRTVFANEFLKPVDRGWKDLLLNVVTGGGKTAIIAALMAYLRVCHEIRAFLVITPNTIVRERLRQDFEKPDRDDSVWKRFQFFPPEYAHFVHDMVLHVLESGSGSAGIRNASITLCNIHQLYTSSDQGAENFAVIMNHTGRIAVFNDEAHNTVAPKYDELLDSLSQSGKTFLRVDTTATPDRADKENPRSRMIYEYGIKQAVKDGIVKTIYVCQPNIKTVELTYTDTETGAVVKVEDIPWEEIEAKRIPATKWVTSPKPLRQQLELAVRRLEEQKLRAKDRYKPILFVVAVSIKDAYNAKRVLDEEHHLNTFVIASKDDDETDISPEQRKEELRVAMTIGSPKDENNYDAVVSVLMLREGWDVRSVSVIALLRKFSSPVYGQQVIGRGLRRMFPLDMEEKERLVVVDHPKLNHGWLWKVIDAYVKENVGATETLDLDEGNPETVEETDDSIITPEPVLEEEEEEIELPDIIEDEDRTFVGSWQDYLHAIEYPRQYISVTNEVRSGESERDLTGTGFVTSTVYSESESTSNDLFNTPKETLSIKQRQTEIGDQLLEIAKELLYNNGLPPSGRGIIYSVLLYHISEKFLGGLTIGQCDREAQLLMLQDSLHYIRHEFNIRTLLKSILDNPPES